jgi:hypothetical protein
LEMKRQSRLIVCSAAILSIVALSAAPALAQQKTVKACTEEWQKNKADNQAKGITEKAYVEKCRADSAKPPAATTTTAPAAPAAAPKTTKKPADPKEAEHARERACGADWKAEKAAGKVPAGMTWPKYWSECDKRKKAAGM